MGRRGGGRGGWRLRERPREHRLRRGSEGRARALREARVVAALLVRRVPLRVRRAGRRGRERGVRARGVRPRGRGARPARARRRRRARRGRSGRPGRSRRRACRARARRARDAGSSDAFEVVAAGDAFARAASARFRSALGAAASFANGSNPPIAREPGSGPPPRSRPPSRARVRSLATAAARAMLHRCPFGRDFGNDGVSDGSRIPRPGDQRRGRRGCVPRLGAGARLGPTRCASDARGVLRAPASTARAAEPKRSDAGCASRRFSHVFE